MISLIDRLNRLIGHAVAWLTLVMALVTGLVVALRYLFDIGYIWLQESVTWMHACVFMLGAAYTLGLEGHVRVDVWYRKRSAKTRALIDLLGSVLFLLPCAGFILWSSFGYVAGSWAIGERSKEAGGLGALYLLKSVILATAVLLILQAIVQIARAARAWRSGE